MTITATVIAHSIALHSPPLTTLQLRYPKFIHSEFMTHRVFSRNASSSRAVPVERLIKDIELDPVIPSFWGKNQSGMQAHEECDAEVALGDFLWSRQEAWHLALNGAIVMARAFAKAGYHKQIVNRLLEPFSHINVVITATEWDNFFNLRCHPDAQPEMRLLAEAIRAAINNAAARVIDQGRWHLPYVDPDQDIPQTLQIKVSVARCARVSYLTTEGKRPTIDEDLQLYDRLMQATPLHASPAEHQATPQQGPCANFTGWLQWRQVFSRRAIKGIVT